MDKKRVKAEAKSLPLKMGLETGELARRARIPQGLEEAFNQLDPDLAYEWPNGFEIIELYRRFRKPRGRRGA
ncbi:hypothetical protein VTJ04DRAFT_164 [Mycothermus thermophilus]|uniref:uncharacterized protein n=1 Tax=Humicola insolens TaxID=85995 RepID=UPI00374462DA